MINNFLTSLLGASWRTTIWGAVAVISAFVTQYPDLVSSVLNPGLAKMVFAIAALISGFITFAQTKDKNVTGGTVPSGEKPTLEATKVAEAKVEAKTVK